MRIGLDCRLSGPTHAGIGRYIENLLIRLPTVASDVEWVFIFDNLNQYEDILANLNKNQAEKIRSVPKIFCYTKHYSLKEQFAFAKTLNRLPLDLLHVPHFNVPLLYRGKIVITIHDLLWHEYKGTQVTTLKPWLYWLKYIAYRFITTQAIKKAKTIFVPAETIKKTVKKYYPTVGSKIVVTKEGADDRLLMYKKNNIERDKKTLIYVGSLYPHKNVRVVIDALKELPEWKLVIVGSRSVFQDEVKQHIVQAGIENQVEFTGYLNDEELAHRLQAATALVQPSFSEGFGLTGIEALALGTPVVASNIAIFREIYQNAAIYFDPNSAKSFIRFLKHVKTSSIWQKKAKNVVEQYSWDRMVEETVQEYRKIL